MKRATLLGLACLVLAGCDDSEPQQPTGGGPGSAATPSADVQSDAAGPCSPVGGAAALGNASYTTDSLAKVDLDGDPTGGERDVTWNPGTTGGVNSATYSFVVMSDDQMANSGVTLGDWALVTNNQTGRQTWAKVMDVGPSHGTGEISQAAAAAVGIQTAVVQTNQGPNTVTVSNPSVTVQVYGGSKDVQGDCSTSLATNL